MTSSKGEEVESGEMRDASHGRKRQVKMGSLMDRDVGKDEMMYGMDDGGGRDGEMVEEVWRGWMVTKGRGICFVGKRKEQRSKRNKIW